MKFRKNIAKKLVTTLMVCYPGVIQADMTIINFDSTLLSPSVSYDKGINKAEFKSGLSQESSLSGFKDVGGKDQGIKITALATNSSHTSCIATSGGSVTLQDPVTFENYTIPGFKGTYHAFGAANTSLMASHGGVGFSLSGISSGTQLKSLSLGVVKGTWDIVTLVPIIKLEGVKLDTNLNKGWTADLDGSYTYSLIAQSYTVSHIELRDITVKDDVKISMTAVGLGAHTNIAGGLSYLAYSSVPEPCTATLSLLGMGALLFRRRR